MKNLAPIALFVYNRLDHIKKTIKSLSKNKFADQSDLYIFSDNAKSHKDVYIVDQIRNFCSNLNNFKSVSLINRNKNFGLANNILSGINEILKKNQKIIVLEDDLLTDKFFLEYMNNALNIYEKNEEVISIHGYVYPLQKKIKDPFFIKGADCWGWATWRRGWKLYNNDSNFLYNEIKKNKYQKEFNFNNSYNYVKMLKKTLVNKNSSWAIKWYASAFLNKKLTLYPPYSLIHNIGNDGSGINNSNNKIYDNDLKHIPIKIKNLEVVENLELRTEFEKFFNSKNSFLVKILNRVFK